MPPLAMLIALSVGLPGVPPVSSQPRTEAPGRFNAQGSAPLGSEGRTCAVGEYEQPVPTTPTPGDSRQRPAILPIRFEAKEGEPQAPSPLSGHGNHAGEDGPLRLPPRGSAQDRDLSGPSAPTPTRSIVTVVASLAIVLGLFFAVVWISRRSLPRGLTPLSKEVVQVLGRAPLAGRQQMHLVRIGNRLLLVSVTPTGAETLTEIADPEEVEHLAALCQQGQTDSATATFRNVLSQLGSEPAPHGFVGDSPRNDRQIAHSGPALPPGGSLED